MEWVRKSAIRREVRTQADDTKQCSAGILSAILRRSGVSGNSIASTKRKK
jgi:hypothetical protein